MCDKTCEFTLFIAVAANAFPIRQLRCDCIVERIIIRFKTIRRWKTKATWKIISTTKTYKTWGRAHLRTKCRFPDERLDNNLWQAQTWLSFFIVRFRLGVVYGLLFWCVLSTSFHCLNTCKKIFRGGHRYVNWNFLYCFHRVKPIWKFLKRNLTFFSFSTCRFGFRWES